MKRTTVVLTLLGILLIGTGCTSGPEEVPSFTVGWSIYAGWQPWDYADNSGILDRWADREGIAIDLVRFDYIPSVEAFVARQLDAVTMTNMEALDMPAASGIDTTVLIAGDCSDGNDAILTRDNTQDLRGQDIYLVELSVSHYLFDRYLVQQGLTERDVRIVNTSDSDIAPAFLANEEQKVVVTWNPMVMQIEQQPGIDKIFTSADTPCEIIDVMAVRTEVLEANPALGRALVGAWYEVMDIMSTQGAENDAALTFMADSAGATLTEYRSQLRTTAMFYTPQEALDFTTSAEIQEKMEFVRQFCFDHGLLGENAPSVDVVGILYPDGSIQGDSSNIKLRFDDTYMRLAANGEL